MSNPVGAAKEAPKPRAQGDFSFVDDHGKTTVAVSATAADVTGKIDISSLAEGSLYIIYSTYISANEVTATLSGADQTDIVVSGGSLVAGDNLDETVSSLTRFDFTNADLLYDTLTVTYANTDIKDRTLGSRARFSGIILTEPSSLVGFGCVPLSGVSHHREISSWV